MPVIELDRLCVRLAGRPVLQDVTCSIGSRSIGLLGPNGAGKSTLIRTLLGFHEADSGRATVLGLDAAGQARGVRSAIGYMPESDAFIEGMSAVRFVRYMAELHGLPPGEAMERAHEALFWVGLGEARYRSVETFSTGMRQRVKLAQAIVHGPRLVLLDEPTNGLDPPGRSHMLRLIQELRRGDEVCVLVSSHLLKDIEAVADEVMILNRGRLVRHCDVKAQRASELRFVELQLVGERTAFLRELADRGLEHAEAARGRVKVVLPKGTDVRELFASAERQGVVIRRLAQRRDTLEDIFLEAMALSSEEAVHGSR